MSGADQRRPAITPAPTDDEAAAIVAVLSAYLAEQVPAVARPERRWAIAGRLTSQQHPSLGSHGLRVGWRTAARLAQSSR